jgi:hypothetical protein
MQAVTGSTQTAQAKWVQLIVYNLLYMQKLIVLMAPYNVVTRKIKLSYYEGCF